MEKNLFRIPILALQLGIAAFPFQPWNDPAAPASIKRLSENADLIAVATSLQGAQVGSQVSFVLAIERVLKGSVLPGATVHASWTTTDDPGALQMQLLAVRGLWFLKSDGGSNYNIMPTAVGHATINDVCVSVPAGDVRARFAYTNSMAVPDKIALELAASAEAVANGEIKSLLLIRPASSGASPGGLTTAHRLLVQSSVPRTRAIGYQGLLLQNDRSALEEVEQQATSLAQANAVALIAASIGDNYRNADPAGIAVLGRMATAGPRSPLLPFKSSAARALAWIHSRESLPILAEMLSDPDSAIRTYGVGGLAMFANNEPSQAASSLSTAPAAPIYQPWYRTSETASHSTMSAQILVQHEAEYIGFWTKWWQDNQADIIVGLPPKPLPPPSPIPGGTTTKRE
jgi:hypothetical protein